MVDLYVTYICTWTVALRYKNDTRNYSDTSLPPPDIIHTSVTRMSFSTAGVEEHFDLLDRLQELGLEAARGSLRSLKALVTWRTETTTRVIPTAWVRWLW